MTWFLKNQSCSEVSLQQSFIIKVYIYIIKRLTICKSSYTEVRFFWVASDESVRWKVEVWCGVWAERKEGGLKEVRPWQGNAVIRFRRDTVLGTEKIIYAETERYPAVKKRIISSECDCEDLGRAFMAFSGHKHKDQVWSLATRS